jgi:CHAT domain-containing protein/Tfp pilus assembly protein PilF
MIAMAINRHFRPRPVLMVLLLSTFVFDSELLAQSSNELAIQKLAQRLVDAKSDDERTMMLEAEKHLATSQLRNALVAIGEELGIKGNYPKALVAFETAKHVAEQLGDKSGAAAAWNGLGRVRILQGSLNESLDSYQKALALCEQTGEKDCSAVALAGVGSAYLGKGDTARAMENHRKALAISEETGNRANAALALHGLGGDYQAQGNYSLSLDYFGKSLSLSQSIGDKSRMAAALNGFGRTHTLLGDTDLALDYLQRSLALREELGDKGGIGSAVNNIGIVHALRGDYGSAMNFFQQGLTVSEELGDKIGIGLGYGNLGIAHRRQGNLALALDYQQRALKLQDSIGSKPAVLRALNNIGLLYTIMGEYALAADYYKRGLTLSEALKSKAEMANLLNNTALNYRMQGEYGLAIEISQKTLQLTKELKDKRGTALALWGQAKSYRALKDYARAAEYAEGAVQAAREAGLRDVVGDTLATLGTIYQASGQSERARATFEEAISITDAIRSQVGAGEQQTQRFFEDKVSPYYGVVDVLASQGKASEALAYAERARARVLVDILRSGRVNVTRAMTLQEKDQERSLRQTLVSLNTGIGAENRRAQPDQNRITELKSRLEKARLEYEDFQAKLYATHPDLKTRRGESAPFSLDQARELLPDSQTALLEYFVTDNTTFLFVLTAAGRDQSQTMQQKPILKLYDLKINRKDLIRRARDLNQKIAANDLEYPEVAREFYDLLVGPARAQLQGRTSFVIVPDDALWETPFQALRSGDGRFLIQTASISYAPSLTVLREMIRSRRPRQPATLLAMGNPALAGQTISRSKNVLMSGSFEALPEAERMVKGLAVMYGTKASKVYVGADAREDLLKTEAATYRVLQLATHGVINNSSPMYSHVVLAQSEDGKEDGLLEAWEIMQLDLKADLAVLSACDTARGRIEAGEGVIGLAWALFVAGCPTTVVSQWKVESSSTTELMLAFHRNLQTGATTSEAMRRAAMKLMLDKRYNHPFYWAGFIVIGDVR